MFLLWNIFYFSWFDKNSVFFFNYALFIILCNLKLVYNFIIHKWIYNEHMHIMNESIYIDTYMYNINIFFFIYVYLYIFMLIDFHGQNIFSNFLIK